MTNSTVAVNAFFDALVAAGVATIHEGPGQAVRLDLGSCSEERADEIANEHGYARHDHYDTYYSPVAS